MTYRDPEMKKQRDREHAAERYERFVGLHLCSQCGAPVEPGKSMCAKHLNAVAAFKVSRKVKGVCRDCTSPARPGKRSCAECARKKIAQNKERRHTRRDTGCCVHCGCEAENRTVCFPCWLKRKARSNLGDIRRTNELQALWDAQDGRCVYTGEKLIPNVNASLDHKVPRAKGGGNELSNLQWVSFAINRAKQDLSESDFFALCRRVVEHCGVT